MRVPEKIWIYIIVLLLPSLALAEKIEYKLTSTLNDPRSVEVSVDTSNLGSFSLIRPRQIPHSKKMRVPKVECVLSSRRQKVRYGKKIECKELVWKIAFNTIGKGGIDVSLQKNLYSSAGWWVLFEWGNIPRIKGYSDIDVCSIQINSEHKICRPLPDASEAPLIMVWGNSSAQKKYEGAYFNLYIDNSQRILKIISWKQLFAQFDYLNRLLVNDKKNNKNIDVVWVGYEKSYGFVGGAAGSQAYITNYAVENGKVNVSDISRLLWISGHEEFHMLSHYSFPLWVSESLAQYYGYKSLAKLGIASKSPAELWRLRKDKIPHSNAGLYFANKKVVDDKNMSYYGLFYEKGAAFWNELDGALKTKGTSLDSYIQLLSSTRSSLIELNKKFVAAVEKVVGKDVLVSLVSSYLSSDSKCEK